MTRPAGTAAMSNAPETSSNDTLPGLMRLLGARAHQPHAATNAADRFLEQDSRDDRDIGGWRVPMGRLAEELDETLAAARRPGRAARPAAAADVREPVRAAATTAALRRGTA